MFYSPTSLRFGGGGEHYILELVKQLKKFGVSSTIVCAGLASGEKESISLDRIETTLTKISATYFEFKGLPLPIAPISSSILRPTEIMKIAEFAKNCDLIYFIHGRTFQDFQIYLLKKILRKPVISGHHCPLYWYSLDRVHDLYINAIGKYLLKKLDAIHVLNKSDLHVLSELGLRRIYLIPNGVDIEKFKPRTHNRKREIFRILFVGRLTLAKGIDILCESIKLLNNNKTFRESIEFVIVGSGPQESLVRQLSKRHKNVVFQGYLGERLPRIYSESDLLVLPSRRETFGLVLVEAQASGLPVVAFNADGPRSILVEGETGSLIDEVNADTLTQEIIRYYSIWRNHRERYEQMRLAARENAKRRFDWAIISRRIYNMLREVAERAN